jgi:hypothetical protein
MVMWGAADKPDPDRLQAGLTLAWQVAALSTGPLQVGPLALCAWLAWALGRSRADLYAQQALAIDAEHGLAEIVASFVNAATCRSGRSTAADLSISAGFPHLARSAPAPDHRVWMLRRLGRAALLVVR